MSGGDSDCTLNIEKDGGEWVLIKVSKKQRTDYGRCYCNEVS